MLGRSQLPTRREAERPEASTRHTTGSEGEGSTIARGSVLVNLLLTGMGLVAAGLVPLGFSFAVGRHDGAAALGHVAIALNLALLLGQIPGTVSSGAAKFIAEAIGAEDEPRADRIFRFLFLVTMALSVVISLGLLAVSPWIERSLHLSLTMVGLAAALVPAYAMYLYFKSSYYGYFRVRTYLFNEVFSDAAFFAVLVTVFLLGATPWLLLPFVLNNLIFILIAGADLGPSLVGGGAMKAGERREALSYCLVNGSGSAASLSRWSLGTVIAGWYLAPHSVGLFQAAVAITAPLSLLPRAISLVTFALMARLHGAGHLASVRAVLAQSTQWLVLLLGIPSGLAIINAGAILGGVYGPVFIPAAAATQLIIAGAYITDISRPSIDALSSTSHVRIASAASFCGLGVSLVIWLTLIPGHGITIAGLGFAAGAAVTAIIPALAAIRYLGSSPSVFLRPAIMLAGLAVMTTLGHGLALVDSAVFVAGMCLLYRHLWGEASAFISSLVFRRTTVSTSLP